LSNQREEAKKTPFIPRSLTAESLALMRSDGSIKAAEEKPQKEMSDALQQLLEWYLLLVRAGSLVFEFEYWKRMKK
jgi:hypothetical protein